MKQHNPHDPKDVEQAEKGRDLKVNQKTEDMKWLLSHPEGRRIAWGLLSDCGVFRISFTGNSTTFFNEGKRSVGNKFYTEMISADADASIKMFKEFQGEINDN